MITVKEYLTQHAKECPLEVAQNAAILVTRVNNLLADLTCPHPDAGLRSGYRPPAYNATVPNAAPTSKHMTGQAVDLNDNDGDLDDWLTDVLLEKYQLWREHPSQTPSWAHLQMVGPKSGRRTFYK